MRTLFIGALLILLIGCYMEDRPPPVPDEVPKELVAHVKTLAVSEQAGVLSALVTLVQAGMIGHYQWTAPTTGSAVVYYQTETINDVPGNSVYILMATKSNITVRARGVDAAGRIGPWSAASDTAQAVTW